MRTLIFTATYNENLNIRNFINKILLSVSYADILIIDDNSPDLTWKTVEKISKNNHKIKLIKRPSKLGLGTAHLLAFNYATINKYDFFVSMDADFSHDPSAIPSLLARLENFDFVIGSRYMEGGSTDYRGYRLFVSKLANNSASKLLRIPLTEFTSSFRAFKLKKFKKIDFDFLKNQGYTFFMTSIFLFYRAGISITEIPIKFEDRHKGESKIPKFEIFSGMLNLTKLFFQSFKFKKSYFLQSSSNSKKDFNCLSCKSKFCIIKFKYPKRSSSNGLNSNMYNCTSMYHEHKPDVVECLQCGLAQISSERIPTNLHELYSSVDDSTYKNAIKAKSKTFEKAISKLKKYIKKGNEILEVGSYYGTFLNALSRQGYNLLNGIEPSVNAFNHCKKNYNFSFINTTFESFSTSKKFSTIFAWDVFEHIEDPNYFLSKNYSLLTPKGFLILSTIDIDSLFAKIMGKNWPWIMDMHLLYFGKNSIENMFVKNGFELIEVFSHTHYSSIKYAYQKFASSMHPLIHRTLLFFDFLIPDILFPFSFGDVKTYVLKKI